MQIRHEFERYEMTGTAASAGYAIGLLWLADTEPMEVYAPKETAEQEARALIEAVETAKQELADLLTSASGDAALILEFQLAVLDDATFQEEALEKIAAGETADRAWNFVLDSEIEHYQASTDIVFHARALDFQDIQARVLRILCNQSDQKIPAGAIVLAENFTPSAFIAHNWNGGGIALTGGSTSSHLAILARQFSVPMLTDIAPAEPTRSRIGLQAGITVLLSSGEKSGKLIVAPSIADQADANQQTLQQSNQKMHVGDDGTKLPLATRDGAPVTLMINLAHLRELENLDINGIDGIGLVRTEFLFAQSGTDEATQFQAYCRILNWAKGRPVFIRTIDAGGDKPFPEQSNSSHFPNLRGLRLSLLRPDFFRVQTRALLRAAAFGPLHVTLPMVANEADFNAALALFDDEARKLAAAKIAHAMPKIGIMVEVPAVALTIERFARAAHFSIGTNDLIQYTLAEPRDAGGIKSSVNDPVILSMIKAVVAAGRLLNRPVSVCGDAASNPAAIPHLLSAGIDTFSVTPPSRPFVEAAIRAFSAGGEA